MRIQHFDTNKGLDELKRDYKRLAVQHHPDKPNGSNEKMQEINAEFQYIVKNYQYLSRGHRSFDETDEFDFDSFFDGIYNDLSREPVNLKTVIGFVVVGIADIMTRKIREDARRTKDTD